MIVNLQSPLSDVFAYKFSPTATKEKPLLGNASIGEFLRMKFDKGCHFGTDELLRSGHYKFHGWSFDFRPFLSKYLYNVVNSRQWQEVYAPNKRGVRIAAGMPTRTRVIKFPING
jgi:hypothetical protein